MMKRYHFVQYSVAVREGPEVKVYPSIHMHTYSLALGVVGGTLGTPVSLHVSDCFSENSTILLATFSRDTLGLLSVSSNDLFKFKLLAIARVDTPSVFIGEREKGVLLVE